jgi:tRNA threonylcarbamoyl adenosine modification protein (Sua5/YciO/YrdC/YwlC family)
MGSVSTGARDNKALTIVTGGIWAMAKEYEIHPQNPQPRMLEEIVGQLRGGAVMLYPTDTSYAIGCDLQSKSAIERVRQIKKLANDKPLTFLCPSLSNISAYALVDDPAYRLLKHFIPGPYTFILPATKLVPKIIQDPKRKTTGLRVPNHRICQDLLAILGNPLISTSAHVHDQDGDDDVYIDVDKAKLFDYFDKLVDISIDDGSPATNQASTVVDLTKTPPVIVRQNMGWPAMDDWLS